MLKKWMLHFHTPAGIISLILPSTSLRPVVEICYRVGCKRVTCFNDNHGNWRNSAQCGHVDYTVCVRNVCVRRVWKHVHLCPQVSIYLANSRRHSEQFCKVPTLTDVTVSASKGCCTLASVWISRGVITTFSTILTRIAGTRTRCQYIDIMPSYHVGKSYFFNIVQLSFISF